MASQRLGDDSCFGQDLDPRDLKSSIANAGLLDCSSLPISFVAN